MTPLSLASHFLDMNRAVIIKPLTRAVARHKEI